MRSIVWGSHVVVEGVYKDNPTTPKSFSASLQFNVTLGCGIDASKW
jgi:hypothetical protein